ncbi:MAG: type VI secretion system baseplate subunit TssG [Deltaproteobacteria bacterium]|nr:type VI secretion system baseplate subunit TssG [Deltaproteobacteria bacterium]
MAQTSRSRVALRELKELGEKIRGTSFFRALLTLERVFVDSVSLGAGGPPEQEQVRLTSTISLAHPSSDLEALEVDEEHDRARLTVTFLGLLGVDSPLPMALVERISWLIFQQAEAGERLRGLFDIFHQRLYSLLFVAWRKSRPIPRPHETQSALYDQLLAVIGYSDALGIGGDGLPALREVRLQTLRSRTVSGLAAMIEHRLGYRAGVRQLELRRVVLAQSVRSTLGRANCQLGESLLLGGSIADRNKISLEVRAEDLPQWERLLPGGQERHQLDEALESYLRDPIDYDVEVTLARAEVPRCQLGNSAHRVGYGAWIGRPPEDFVRAWPGRRAS